LEELDDAIRAEGGSATLVPLNMTDSDGIARLGAALHERHGKLDILVGNAGIAGPSSPLGHIDLKAWTTDCRQRHCEFSVDPLLEPLLRQSDAGRAVFVTSGVASKANAYSAPTPPPRPRWIPGAGVGGGDGDHPDPRQLFSPGPIRPGMRAQVFPARTR